MTMTSKFFTSTPAILFASLIPTGLLFAGNADKWYLESDAGINFQQDTFTTFLPSTNPINPVGETKFRPGERVDLKVGYNLNTWIAAELEAGFVYNSITSIASDPVSGVDFKQFPLMANMVLSRHISHNWSVYAGGGAGCIVSQWNCGINVREELSPGFPPVLLVIASPGPATTATDFLFGYQVLAGIKYDISRRWDFKVGYKFFATAEGHDWAMGSADVKTDATMSHSIFAALTYKF